jgi:hypothetical protein
MTSRTDATKRYIEDLFDGVTVGDRAINNINVDKRLDGTIHVHLICELPHDVKLKFPPGWHQHEVELSFYSGNTIRHCKICGKTSRLEQDRWVDIADGDTQWQ